MGNCELCSETNICVCISFFNDEWNWQDNQCKEED